LNTLPKYLSFSIFACLFVLFVWSANSRPVGILRIAHPFGGPGDTTDTDSLSDLPFPFNDDNLDPLDPNPSPLLLKNPENITTNFDLNPETNEFDLTQKVGNLNYRFPDYLTFQEFVDKDFNDAVRKNWRDRIAGDDVTKQKGFQPKIIVPGEAFAGIFGSNVIDIRPQGSAELIFGGNFVRTQNPALPIRQQRVGAFNFQQKIQMNLVGKIGDKIQLQTNYNTETGFNFDNRVNLKYEGKEDEIIQLLEAGNVNLPLTGTLITGSQSLMGVKSKLKFGRLTATTIFSQQQGDRKNITVQGGAQAQQFDISASAYDANRHFFLSQWFKDRYDASMATLPNVTSPFNVTRVEVYITNRTYATTNVRNIAGFSDLGESNPAYFNNGTATYTAQQPGAVLFPRNENNNLQPSQLIALHPNFRDQTNDVLSNPGSFTPQMVPAIDFEFLQNARLLNPTEYTLNPLLGYVSLNQSLNADEVLAVAFQYTVNTSQGQQVYQVGEFSTDIQGTGSLVLKLLKSTQVFTRKPIWDLMMKNIYSLNGFQISKDNFKLNILYQDEKTSVRMNVIPEGENVNGRILLQLFDLDKLNNQNDPQADGFFDFIEGRTIQADKGRIIFPMREPFRGYLRNKFQLPQELALANKYAFDSLYVTTQQLAQLDAQHNRFYLQGSYQSASGSEISLNAMNVPQGSVAVTAGGVPLTENVDYTVDYALGRVRIINQGLLNSQTPINISLETNTLFAIQSKRLMGAHFDYMIDKDFGLGATIMNLTERPMTQKINIGDEPISNTIVGFNGNIKRDSRWLTRMVDKLPFYSTKETSTITANWETARLIPGHSKIIGRDGLSYIDDFEGAESTIDIRNFGNWFLASTPAGQGNLFKEGDLFNDRAYNFNRARLNWYTIDPLFARNGNTTPEHIQDSPMQSNNFMRQIIETEIFPNKARPNGQVQIMPVLDLHFNPNIRGPYNYDILGGEYSSGLNADGSLKNPRSRWGGIMRRVETTDFESANIDYIEFWMMDPFADGLGPGTAINTGTGGDFYLNIGNISEDVLRDGQQSFENGLPITPDNTNYNYTTWGKYPTSPPLVNAFDNLPESRPLQDVGMDGLPSDSERVFFQDYLSQVQTVLNPQAYAEFEADPSADDYRFFRNSAVWDATEADILTRYTLYNGLEGNSRLGDDPIESYPTAANPLPNIEDINRDNTLSVAESYFQYKISLRPQDMVVGQNYIIDKVPGKGKLSNGQDINVDWYQFRVPIRSFTSRVGSISDFRSIRFIRMFFHNFSEPVVARMARLELVRAEWRRFEYSLKEPGLFIGNDLNTTFQVSTVNIEENGEKIPVNYVLPPQIRREVDVTTTNLQQLNEQSLQIRLCNLEDGEARAVYKNTNLDVRAYKRIKMEVHAESMNGNQWPDNQVTAFIRLGTDFVNNYYEYEIPLKRTPDGTTNPEQVWANAFDFALEALTAAKIKRNREMISNPNIQINNPYYAFDPDQPANRITVVGVPQISGVKTLMIGIRNPQNDEFNPWPDDGAVACVEVWMNELRVSEYFEPGGWAANARVTAKLADLGTIALAGSRSTFGFGSIEKKPIDRSRDNNTAYSIITNLELGKFFPKPWNLSIPLYYEFGEIYSNPQFNPLDADVRFRDALDYQISDNARDSLRNLSQTYQRRRSINFTNVRKNKGQGQTKNRFYNVENFDLTYAFADNFQRTPQVEFNYTKNYDVGLGYTYSPKAWSFEPFKKLKFLGKSKAFDLIRDFNISPVPSRIAFRSDIARDYNAQKLRNTSDVALLKIDTTYFKSFTWQRIYDIKLPLTKSIQIDFLATNQSRVDEEPGQINTASKRDSVIRNLRRGGRNTNYQHSMNASYNVPFSKIPLINFMNGTIGYASTYSWVAAPLVRDPVDPDKFAANPFGNSISNSANINMSAQANFVQLYNKIPYLKRINQKKPGQKTQKKAAPKKDADPNAPKDPKAKKDAKKDSTKKKETPFSLALEQTAKVLMMLKNGSVTYTETNGTVLPGFTENSRYVGRDWESRTPTVGFLFGDQSDIRSLMVQRGALTRDTSFNNAFTKSTAQNLTWNATLEPVPGMRITLNGNRNYTENFTTIYKYNAATDVFEEVSTLKTGTFSVSTNTWGTAFGRLDNRLHSSGDFDRFLQNRRTIATRLSTNSIDPLTGYPVGFGSTQQDVMLLSFISTYTGTDPFEQDLTLFQRIPRPNWRITYDGLTKIPFFKKYFKSISLGHGFRSTFNVGSFTTNLLALQDPNAIDPTGNVIPQLNILMASISEQFGPLLNIDMTWKNSLITKVEFRRNRDLSLSLQNSQITEVTGREITIGTGYIVKNFELPFTIQGSGKKIKSDLNCRADVSIRTNKTVVRRVPIEGQTLFDPILSAGQRNISIKISADYVVNQRVTVRLFFDRIMNTPFISNQFPNSNTNFGISLRFTLNQ
jgi:cell surface protein SprA